MHESGRKSCGTMGGEGIGRRKACLGLAMQSAKPPGFLYRKGPGTTGTRSRHRGCCRTGRPNAEGNEFADRSKSALFVAGDDGLQHRSAWAEDAELLCDVGKDGKITDQREFVFTEWAPGATDDRTALRAVFDSNGDGKLTAADAKFSDFKVLVTNADGTTTAKTLAQLGITEINLLPDTTKITLPDGSTITGQSAFGRRDPLSFVRKHGSLFGAERIGAIQ